MSYVAVEPKAYKGKTVGNGQCVAFIQQSAAAPHTSRWHKGAKVRGSNTPAGTAIATFEDGKYINKTDGSSHAAILLEILDNGLLVLDQWGGQAVHERIIRYKAGEGTPNNDGDAYFVIE